MRFLFVMRHCLKSLDLSSELTRTTMSTCTRNGCKKEFDPDANNDGDCVYHPGGPVGSPLSVRFCVELTVDVTRSFTRG